MKKVNYDNALTLLFEGKENELESNILTLEGEDLYKEIAFVLTELSLIDKNSGKKIISESERKLLEEDFISRIKNAWRNLWGDANQQVQQNAGQNLNPQQQQAIQQAQQKVAEATKVCRERKEGDWEAKISEPMGLFGAGAGSRDTSPEAKERYISKTIQSCIDDYIKGPQGKRLIGQLNDFLNNTITGRVLVGIVAIGAMAYVTGAIGAHGETKIKTFDDGKVNVSKSVSDNSSDSTLDNQTHVKVNPDGSLTKVDVGKDGKTVGVIERDHGMTDLKTDQVQQTADNIIKTIKDINKDPDLGGKPVKSVTLKFHSDKSNTDGSADADGDGIPDSNDCNGGPCAETHNQKSINAVLKIVKQGLEKEGIPTKVKAKSEIGGLAKDQVSKNSQQAKAQQGTTVTIDSIDAPIKTVKDTKFQPGPYGPLVNNPPAPVPKACYLILNGKKVVLGNGDFVNFYGKLIPKKIQPTKGGQKFSGIITRGSRAAGDDQYDLKVLGGFTLEQNLDGLPKGQYLGVQINKLNDEESKDTEMYLVSCGSSFEDDRGKGDEDRGKGDEDRGKGDEDRGKGDEEPVPVVPTDFLQGNRNMQLAYLASNFLPQGEDFWSNLYLKQGTVIPSGFLDAALGQGKYNPGQYLKAYYDKLKDDNSFTRNINLNAWIARIKSNQNQALIKWVRNTRKNIGSFVKNLRSAFPEFGIGKRVKAQTEKPGEMGKAMALAGESLNGRYDLINELSLGTSSLKAGFNEDLFMKNLPQFMAMLSMMYYSAEGKPLPYNKQAVLDKCKQYGCTDTSGKKYKRTKSVHYKFKGMEENNSPLSEEIKRIKNLMK